MQGYFDQVRGNTICIVRVLRCVSGSQGGLVTEFTQIPLRAVFWAQFPGVLAFAVADNTSTYKMKQ